MNSADASATRRPNNTRNNNATRRARNQNRLKNAVINASTFRRNITRNANRLKNAVVEVPAPPAVVEMADVAPVSINAITAPRVEPWPVVPEIADVPEFSLPRAVADPEFSLPRVVSEVNANEIEKIPVLVDAAHVPMRTTRNKYAPLLTDGYGHVSLEKIIDYLVKLPKFKSNRFIDNVKTIVCTFLKGGVNKKVSFVSFTEFENYLKSKYNRWYIAFYVKSHTEHDLGSYGFGKNPKREKRSLFLYDNYGSCWQIPFSSSISDPITGELFLNFNIDKYSTPLPDILVNQIKLLAESHNEARISQWSPIKHIHAIMAENIEASKR